ncbi:MAG TPA: hypothetical protein VES65_02155 [Solirubrobacteraceae bacterium]|nr:hypothetical protein [Solirubrobacteraceae bacterium]
MTTQYPRLSSPMAGAPPSVLGRQIRDLALSGVAASLALAIALGVSLSVSDPNLLLFFALVLGALGIVALMVSPRYEVTVAILALYLGLADGPVKLLSANQAASSVRDILIGAVCVGAIVRIIARRERVSLPPLFGWVLAFVVLVVAEAFNPNTHGTLKIVGGFRQQLEWVPFFFFGYMLIRSKERCRKLFIVLGVIALANGVVSTYQTSLTPAQLAGWGPGYSERVNGSETLTGRKYVGSNGVARVRPPGLGSDSGFGAGVGVLALPGALALFATGRRRRRWLAVPLFLGAALAVATGLGRLQVVGAVIALIAFALLSLSAGRRVTRPLGALLAFVALALPFGAVLVAAEGGEVFSRYTSIAPENVATTSTSYKEKSLGLIPHYISSAPFGFGLATTGPASSFGGKVTEELEGHGVTAETQYNYVVDELGVLGLILFVGLLIQVGVLVVRRLPRIADIDMRIYLAAVFAPIFAYAIMGLRGAFTDTSAAGPYFWFAVGIAAYWLAGPGRAARSSVRADAS